MSFLFILTAMSEGNGNNVQVAVELYNFHGVDLYDLDAVDYSVAVTLATSQDLTAKAFTWHIKLLKDMKSLRTT